MSVCLVVDYGLYHGPCDFSTTFFHNRSLAMKAAETKVGLLKKKTSNVLQGITMQESHTTRSLLTTKLSYHSCRISLGIRPLSDVISHRLPSEVRGGAG